LIASLVKIVTQEEHHRNRDLSVRERKGNTLEQVAREENERSENTMEIVSDTDAFQGTEKRSVST